MRGVCGARGTHSACPTFACEGHLLAALAVVTCKHAIVLAKISLSLLSTRYLGHTYR